MSQWDSAWGLRAALQPPAPAQLPLLPPPITPVLTTQPQEQCSSWQRVTLKQPDLSRCSWPEVSRTGP